jgi:mRNA interferase RelE/StbE
LKVQYRKRFLKDLAAIPANRRPDIEDFAFEQVRRAESLGSLGVVEQMRGYPDCFKVRFGPYRVGLRLEDDVVVFERVLHRREIYRHFP